MVEPQVVREEVRYLALEGIELGEGVLAQAHEEVRAETRLPDSSRELGGEWVALVVEEVLLKLIENDVDVAFDSLRRGTEPLDERPP